MTIMNHPVIGGQTTVSVTYPRADLDAASGEAAARVTATLSNRRKS